MSFKCVPIYGLMFRILTRFHALYFGASCIHRNSIVWRRVNLARFPYWPEKRERRISRYSYLMKTLISSEYGLTISCHVTVLRQSLSEKNTDYIINFVMAGRHNENPLHVFIVMAGQHNDNTFVLPFQHSVPVTKRSRYPDGKQRVAALISGGDIYFRFEFPACVPFLTARRSPLQIKSSMTIRLYLLLFYIPDTINHTRSVYIYNCSIQM